MYRRNPLSFKRRQSPKRPLSRFISHLYQSPKPNRPRPTIQIPDNAEEEQTNMYDFAEQGYGKDLLNDWIPDGGLGTRKYEDLTAIGI